MSDAFARFGTLMVRWRWVVLAVWLVVLVIVGAFLTPRAPNALKGGGFIDPDSESARAAAILDTEFNASTLSSVAVVFHSSTATVDDLAFKDQVTRAADSLSKVNGVRSVQTFYGTQNSLLVSADRHTTVALVPLEGNEGDIQELVPNLRASVKDVSMEHYVTGTPAVNSDLQTTSKEDLQRSGKFTVPIVVILLLLVFRTVVAAMLPLLIGACSTVLALGGLYLVSTQTEVSIYALNITTMLGLGLGIEFSLVLVSRFREELAGGRSVADAVSRSMATAGRLISYAALGVLLAMVVLTLVFNLLVLRSISVGVMLAAFTGLLATVTLLPALLAVLGHRVELLRVVPRRRPAANQAASAGIWYGLSMAIMRRPWIRLGASLGILLILALPMRELTLYGATADIMPPHVESTHGVQVMNLAFDQSQFTPIQIVLKAPTQDGVWNPEFLGALKRVSDSAAADPRNEQVFSLATLATTAGVPPDRFSSLTLDAIKAVPGAADMLPQVVNLNRNDDTVVITVFSNDDRFSRDQQAFITNLRDNILPPIRRTGAVASTYVGGDGAVFIDFRDATASRLPFMVLGVTGVTFILLLLFFQSVFVPVKIILLNLASILATYGVLTMVFQYAWGDTFLGFTSLGGLGIFTPATLFAILFALGTNYEMFMLSRVKEYLRQTHDNAEAVARGLQDTAGVTTATGLILVGTFGSFATANVVAVKEIGIGLAVGVLLSLTIVRIIMVPATMRVLGDANWWTPAWLKRIVPEPSEGPSGDARPAEATSGRVARSAASPDAAVAVQPWPAFNVGHLRTLTGSLGTDDIVLLKTRPLRIGRDESNDLQFFDDGISRFHARVDFDASAGTHVVMDLNSTNGVYVNGLRIAAQPASTPLNEGDRVEIGATAEVVLVYEVRPLASEAAAGRPVSVGV